MNLLLSTSRGIVSYEEETRSFRRVLPELTETYGISWTPDGQQLLVACTTGHGHRLTFDDLDGYARSEVGTIFCGASHSLECLSAPHQIHCVNDTYLMIANTGRNAVVKMRLDDFCMSTHRIDDVFWDRFDPLGKQGSHINSVFHQGDTVYMVAHNFQKGTKIYALSWPAIHVKQIWSFVVGGMHNVACLDGRLLVCDSLHGCLVDALTGSTVWSNGGIGMTRGLAANDRYVFVGESSYATRDQRANSSGGIWVLERGTFRAVEYLEIPGVGGVNEIRITDDADRCHHGHPLRRVLEGGPRTPVVASCADERINRPMARLHADGWRVVSGVLSTVDVCEPAQLEAKTDELLLLVQASAHCHPAMGATFTFAPTLVEGHASVFIDYQGPGDTWMVAGMIRRTAKGTSASIWINAETWQLVSEISLDDAEGARGRQADSTAPGSEWAVRLLKGVVDSWSGRNPVFPNEAGEYAVVLQRNREACVLNVNGRDVLQVEIGTRESGYGGGCGIRLSGRGIAVSHMVTPSMQPPSLCGPPVGQAANCSK